MTIDSSQLARLVPDVRRVVVLSLVAAGIAVLAWGWATRDQREINSRLARIQRLISKQPDESALSGLARAQEVMRYFSARPRIGLGPPMSTIEDRQELAVLILQVRSSVTSLKVSVRDKVLDLAPDHLTATMDLTADGTVTYERRTERDIREFELKWIKQDGHWVVEQARVTSTIQRPSVLQGTTP
jgi:hypothetical protein